MTTPDPLHDLVRRHISSAIAAAERHTADDRWNLTTARTKRLLAAIQATGRLLPHGGAVIVATTDTAPGFTEHTEWSTEPSVTPRYVTGPIESDREIVCPTRDPEQAMRDYLRAMPNRPALARRTVYTGPWQPAEEQP